MCHMCRTFSNDHVNHNLKSLTVPQCVLLFDSPKLKIHGFKKTIVVLMPTVNHILFLYACSGLPTKFTLFATVKLRPLLRRQTGLN